MSKQTITMLEVTPDKWSAGDPPMSAIPGHARHVLSEVNRPEVREWIDASPLGGLDFRNLRWLLCVLRRARVAEPRRLTWRERITGRFKP